MRIIAGIHKGRKLTAPGTPDTRPVTDRVKEAVFSSLADEVEGAKVLDLYAGAGSFGIEALSRGAAEAVFVETGRQALEALEANLAIIGVTARVVNGPVERFVGENPESFDLVFCDPPWSLSSEELGEVLEQVGDFLAEEGTIVVSRRASDTVPNPAGLRIDHDRRYGDTRIIRYRRL